MKCYKDGGCGPYEYRGCNECPASKESYRQPHEDSITKLVKSTGLTYEQCKKAIVYCGRHPEISIMDYLESKGLIK